MHLRLLVPFLFFVSSFCLNIILNNDDGFSSAQIRELHRLLNNAGHNAWIVAPLNDQSGRGGTLKFTDQANISHASDYSTIPKGAPSFGHDPNDGKIWYYDGSPATCTFFALDYVVPNFFRGASPDLFVNGPNFGTNIGSFMYTLSGTIGATTSAIGRGIPAISVSAAAYGPSRGFKNITENTRSGFPDPATIIAELTTKLVGQLANNTQPGTKLLPPGYGISVNFPKITSLSDDSCLYPPFIRTRMTGHAATTKVVFDAKTGKFHGADTSPRDGIGVNSCINGNCTLPGEGLVVNGGCQTSVSMFMIDYDAPENQNTRDVDARLAGLVTGENEARNYTKGSVPRSPTPRNTHIPRTSSGQSLCRSSSLVFIILAILAAVG